MSYRDAVIVPLACTALPGANARECCRNGCGDPGYLARYIHANGSVALRWVCDWCEDFKTAGDLPHTILPTGVTLEQLPLRQDNSDDPPAWPDCVVCGQPASEMHHWAPRSIFPDWPTTPLLLEPVVPMCAEHHSEWHDRMRAHGLRWPHELRAA